MKPASFKPRIDRSDFLARMYVTHSRFYRIVSGYVLQRERVDVLTGLGEKRNPLPSFHPRCWNQLWFAEWPLLGECSVGALGLPQNVKNNEVFRFRGRFAIGISWFHRFPGVSAFSGHVAARPSRTECHGTPHSCSNTGGSVHQPESGVSGMNQACLVALISASSSYGSLRPRRLGAMCRSGSRPPTVQPSIDLIRVEGLGSKVIAQPFTGVVVLGMIFLLKCFKQLGKPRRSPGVFGWTLSLSRDTHLSKRFISEQYTFEEQFVPPAVVQA